MIRNSKGQFIKGKEIFRDCLICKKRFRIYPSQLKKGNVNFCSRRCYSISMIGQEPRLSFKGKKHSEKTVEKMKVAQIRGKHWNWKGGKPKCIDCGKELLSRRSKRCHECYKILMFGSGNPNWRNGISETLENYWGRRRLRMKNAEGSHTQQEWEDLKKEYNYMCLCCKRVEPEIKLTKDHIIPVSKGGSNYIENLQPLCQSCNSIKYTKAINFINIWQKQNQEIS